MVDCILADVIPSRNPGIIQRVRRRFGAGAVATWTVHLYVVMVGRTPDQMYLAGNVENGVDSHTALAVAPSALQGRVRWLGWGSSPP